MKILITGGAGFIGSHLARALFKKRHQVSIADPFVNFSGGDFFKNFSYRQKLISEAKLFRTLASDSKVWKDNYEVVVHLAGIPVISPKKGDFFKINIAETEKVLKKARKTLVRRFVFMSSIYAYGHYSGRPYSENLPLEPVEPYGITKAIGEYLTKFFFFDREWITIRTAGVFGPGDHNNRVFQLILENQQPLFLTKKTKRIFIYIDDLIAGLVKAIEAKVKNEAFNLTSGICTLEEFAKVAKKYLPDLQWRERERPKGELVVGQVDINKAKKLLLFKPKFTLEEGIKDYFRKIKKLG